jgi:hypothetical protein
MATVKGSVEFLTSYATTLNIAKLVARGDPSNKGKIIHEGVAAWRSKAKKEIIAGSSGWCAPPVGWVKLNADAGFRAANGDASTGVIIQDSDGKVLLTAWRLLRNMVSVEAEAYLQGVRLTMEWIKQPLLVELDCQVHVRALEGDEANRRS